MSTTKHRNIRVTVIDGVVICYCQFLRKGTVSVIQGKQKRFTITPGATKTPTYTC